MSHNPQSRPPPGTEAGKSDQEPTLSFWQQSFFPFFSLFASAGTLLCCALPAMLVTLGLGASLAGLVSAAPWITAISEYKVAIFAVAGLLLGGVAYMQWHSRLAPCPADPLKAKACRNVRKAGYVMTTLSFLLYAIGFFFAFLAANIFYG